MLISLETNFIVIYLTMAQQPLVGRGLLILEASRTHSVIHTTLCRAPLDEWSARSTELHLATHNTPKRQTFMPPVGFKTAIPASKRTQTHALDRAATWIGFHSYRPTKILHWFFLYQSRDVDNITGPSNHHVLCLMEPRHVSNQVSRLQEAHLRNTNAITIHTSRSKCRHIC